MEFGTAKCGILDKTRWQLLVWTHTDQTLCAFVIGLTWPVSLSTWSGDRAHLSTALYGSQPDPPGQHQLSVVLKLDCDYIQRINNIPLLHAVMLISLGIPKKSHQNENDIGTWLSMRYPLVTQTAEATVSSWAEYRCCHSVTDTGQWAVACTSLAFQRFGRHKEVLFILCTNSNTQARDVKLRLMQKR